MTSTTMNESGHTPLVTEIKETEAFGYHISLSDGSLYISPKKPIDDGDEVVAAFCETWKAQQRQARELGLLLKAIINDLPTNRDWLDPAIERAARAASEGVS